MVTEIIPKKHLSEQIFSAHTKIHRVNFQTYYLGLKETSQEPGFLEIL